MSTNEKGVSTTSPVTAAEPATNHAEAAQERLQEIRVMRTLIPRFVIPDSSRATVRLNSAASVPPDFVEITVVALTNEKALVRGESMSPAEMRDFTEYADAYGPFADELEAFAKFVRHSVTAARNKVGTAALNTYNLTKRLAKQPETAHLAPYAANMRRALRRVPKLTPEEAAQKAAERAAKAAARAARKAAKLLKVRTPDPTTEQTS